MVWDVLDWNLLAHYRDKWRAAVNTVMEIRIHYDAENVLTI